MRRPRLPGSALDAAVGAFNRNPWTTRALAVIERPPERAPGLYNADGLQTWHLHEFMDDPRFRRAYARAVQAGTFDYGVHWRTHTVLWAAATAARREGAFVECGTARGFMASAVCDYLDWTDRPFYLLDTFATSDRPEAVFYADGPEPVRANFAQWPGARLVVGEVPGTLAEVDVDRVAFLHVDMNLPPPEAAAVRHFWPRLVPGAIMVLDDYGGYGESRASFDRLAAELDFNILTCPTGQGIVLKG